MWIDTVELSHFGHAIVTFNDEQSARQYAAAQTAAPHVTVVQVPDSDEPKHDE